MSALSLSKELQSQSSYSLETRERERPCKSLCSSKCRERERAPPQQVRSTNLIVRASPRAGEPVPEPEPEPEPERAQKPKIRKAKEREREMESFTNREKER